MAKRVSALILALGLLLPASAWAQDCINYEDYLHWVHTMDTPGEASGISVEGSYCAIADRLGGLHIADVSEPEEPSIVATVDSIHAYDVALEPPLCVVADDDYGLYVLDVSEPTSPEVLSRLFTGGMGRAVAILEDYAFVGHVQLGLQVVDITLPHDPHTVAGRALPDSVSDLAIEDDLLAIALHESGVYLYDVSEPSAPILLSTLDTPGTARSVYHYRDDLTAHPYVLVADFDAGVHFVDVGDPASPEIVSTVVSTEFEQAVDVLLVGQRAVVAAWGNIWTADASDPLAPQVLGRVAHEQRTEDLVLWDGYLFVVGRWGLDVIDAHNLDVPEPLATWEPDGRPESIQVFGDLAFVSAMLDGHVQIVDVSDPTVPVPVTTVNISSAHPYEVDVIGDYMYVAAGNQGLRIFDIQDPANATEVGYLGVGTAVGIEVRQNLAYLAWYTGNPQYPRGGLAISDVSNPNNPTLVGNVEFLSRSSDVALSGEFAFVTQDIGEQGVTVIDVSDPVAPDPVATLPIAGYPTGIYIQGEIAYVAARPGGFVILDISIPLDPQILSTLSTPGTPYSVSVSEGFAYVAGSGSGLEVFDVIDPTQPRYLGSSYNGTSYNCGTRGVAATGSVVFAVGTYCSAPVMNEQCRTNVGVEVMQVPSVSSFVSAWPNPFRASVTIGYVDGRATIGAEATIDGAGGRLVRRLSKVDQASGPMTWIWDGRDNRGMGVTAGVYFVRLEVGGAIRTQKLVMTR